MLWIGCTYQAALCGICVEQYKCSSCSNTPSSDIIGGACYCDTAESLGSGCLACTSLDTNCIQCSSTSTCTACTGSYLKYGPSCVTACPGDTYKSGTYCYGKEMIIFMISILLACSTLDSYCTTCNSSSTCLSCSNSLVALGQTCTDSCPGTDYNNGGLCTCKRTFF